MTDLIDLDRLRRELSEVGTSERAVGAKAYLKSDLEFLGAAVPDMRRWIKKWLRERPDLSRAQLVSAAKQLWRLPVNDFRHSSAILLQLRGGLLDPRDLPMLERMIRESKTWAYVDLLAVHVVGPLAERHDLSSELDRWAADPDFWIRRSAMLALLGPLKRGEGEWKRFARYADDMLEEDEFFIRKAIGWILRDVSKIDPARVVAWLEPRAARASGVTMREAVRYLDESDRERLMTLSRGG